MKAIDRRLEVLEARQGTGFFVAYEDYGAGERFVIDGEVVDRETFGRRLELAGRGATLIRVQYVKDWRRDLA
jgi:hypothetical protein